MQQQNNNPYNQPSIGPMMPPPQIGAPRPRGWRERMMRRFGMQETMSVNSGYGMPAWMLSGSVLAYAVAFATCTLFFGYAMPTEFAIFSIVSVLLFFYGTKQLAAASKRTGDKSYAKNLFVWALMIRVLWVLFSYFYYNERTYGRIDGFGDDSGWYMDYAKEIAQWIQGNIRVSFSDLMSRNYASFDDTGYPVWLGILYVLSSDSSDIFVPMIAKSILGAYSCLCIYHVAKRHFGQNTARLAGLFMCLNPYTLFWCSSLLKETEMMFLCCLYVDKIDEVLTSGKKLTFLGLLPGLLAASALFFFRAALAVVAFLAILVHVVLASERVMNAGKKVLVGMFIGVVLLLGMGDRIRTQSHSLVEQVQSGQQKENMEWRSRRKGGNAFAKYAGAAVFAPMIFTMPFPTFNMSNESQISQMEMSGANFIKNILSFFVIVVFVLLLISGEWRKHVFILAYTLGYHVVLIMSPFAQSGRFHMPVWPMLMMFAAYGIQMARGNAKLRGWFPKVLILEVLICIAWNWFKLKGRGMI